VREFGPRQPPLRSRAGNQGECVISNPDAELENFRAEARAWLEANFPKSLKGREMLAAAEVRTDIPELAQWRKAIGAKGWATPTWPAEYGGGGLDAAQARVLRQEMSRIGAFNPLLFGMGITMIGPTILDYGTEAQKRKHLPPIVRGEVQWCVGYSEPNAGSDLASLQTRAVDAGDHWVINGQKTWTSGAQYSDWCGMLVRTDTKAKKHEGISFLLVDMHQKGVETRPIALIAGASPFCETFLTDVTAPKDALLGQLNVGWSVGKRLLQHERASQTGSRGGPAPAPLSEVAKKYVGVDAAGRLSDLDLRQRVTDHMMAARAHELTLARAAAEAKGNNSPGNAMSVLKNSATSVAQTRAELTLEIMGSQGMGWEGDAFSRSELEAVRGWLGGKAMSIYGGSFEIQNNIISKRILGLPDTTQSA
jgi:alkylation response protein AidB-like acyl-CoA dehydrogenase